MLNSFKKKNCPQKVEKTTLKSRSESLFFLTAWPAQTAQTEELMLQNVAYRPTIYRTGVLSLAVGTIISSFSLTICL